MCPNSPDGQHQTYTSVEIMPDGSQRPVVICARCNMEWK